MRVMNWVLCCYYCACCHLHQPLHYIVPPLPHPILSLSWRCAQTGSPYPFHHHILQNALLRPAAYEYIRAESLFA
jgi:hypothetical protein